MFFEFPEEMQKLMDILEPWRVGAALREDAPEEIKKLHKQTMRNGIRIRPITSYQKPFKSVTRLEWFFIFLSHLF